MYSRSAFTRVGHTFRRLIFIQIEIKKKTIKKAQYLNKIDIN